MVLAPALLEALLDIAGTLFLYLAWAICIGLLWSWRHTIGVLVDDIASSLNFNVSFFGHHLFNINAGSFVQKVNTDVQNALSAYALGCDIAIGRLFAGLAWTFQEIARSSEWVGRELLHFSTWLLQSYLVSWIRAQLAPLFDVAGVVKWAVHHFGAAESFLKHAFGIALHGIEAGYRWSHAEIDRLNRWAIGIDRTLKDLERHAAHAVVSDRLAIGAGAVPLPIGRTIADLKRLARKHEGIFGAAVFGGLMANVLGLSSWRCLSKGPIGRVSRALCGLGSNALNDLLSVLVDAFILTDVCAVIGLLDQAAELVISPLDDFIGDVGSALCHGDYSAPPILHVPALSLPSSPSYALSLV
jgi:hypothetical protein